MRNQSLENQVTEDMADNQIEGWLKLGKLQQQVTEKYPNVQVSSELYENLTIPIVATQAPQS